MGTVTIDDIDIHQGNTIDVYNDMDDPGKKDQKSRFIHLRAKGLSYSKIDKELKVSTSTLSNWNQDLLVEIAQAKAMELEALQEDYFMLKEGRIKLLGRQHKKIQEEIRGRAL